MEIVHVIHNILAQLAISAILIILIILLVNIAQLQQIVLAMEFVIPQEVIVFATLDLLVLRVKIVHQDIMEVVVWHVCQ